MTDAFDGRRALLAWAACLLFAGSTSAETPAAQTPMTQSRLSLLPGDFVLSGPAAQQRLVLEESSPGPAGAERLTGELREAVQYTSSDEKIAKVVDGVALPVANGQVKITATAGGKTAAVKVGVVGLDKPFEYSFRNHVEPVLAKSGCNSGACHGALAGKRGFRLSLRGFDPDADYAYITHQARGRRITLSDPGRSLVLTKPTGAIPHKGGVRFSVDSPEYRILSEWIAAGAPAPKADDARLNRLEILPAAAILKPGVKQQLIVRAHFSDGHAEDVTRWAKYTSNNDSVAQVEPSGLVQVTGQGEGAISAWFQSWNAVSTVSVPYTQTVSATSFAAAPPKNFIDELVLAKLQALNLPPSPPASDAEFLRRSYLDTIGLLPTADEARHFLADTSPGKREALIEQLLNRPEFVDYWAYKWSDLLLVSSEKLKPPAMWAYYQWIRNNVSANTPWDKFARSVVTATGSALENGAANFFVLHQDPPDLAETVSSAFLGMSINCARCHNHPLEKWTNDQYFGMANLFARVRRKDGAGEGNRIVYTVDEGDWTQPRTGKPQPPQPLDGEALPLDSPIDRREHLARWLTAAENPYFSRAITNRVWANFFGVGLVEKVDDLRLTNPASNEQLLAATARHLIENHYDLKALMRTILQSRTYQRSSQALPENSADQRFYAHYYPRRLMAEVLLDAISQVSGSPTAFANYAVDWRAMQLPDANVNSYFLKSFGRSSRQTTCECERSAEPSMVQVLHLSNGDTLNKKLEAKNNRIEKVISALMPDAKIVEDAYLSALSRYPTEQETQQLTAALASAKPEEKRVVIEDLYWSILSSKEFLFNH